MHVLLAERQMLLRDALCNYLKTARPGIRVTDVGTMMQLHNRLDEDNDVDLLLIDMAMPGFNGRTDVAALKRAARGASIVVLAECSDGSAAGEAMRGGADGFLHKDLSGRVVMKALEIVLSGGKYMPVCGLAPSMDMPDPLPAFRAEGKVDDGPVKRLTPRERDVLNLLVEGHSNREMASRLHVKDITVSFHLKGLFRKLDAINRTQAAINAVRLGWAA